MMTLDLSHDLAPVLDAASMRQAEEKAFESGLDPFLLMQRAGRGAAEAIMARTPPQDTLVLCGCGNNGGDGYVVAAALHKAGWAVRVAALAPPVTPQAKAARALWTGEVVALDQAAPGALLVDALFGIGLSRPLSPEIVAQLQRFLKAARTAIAIDLPSGVVADSGALCGAPGRFDLTISFHSLKPAHLLQPAAHMCGDTHIVDIGLPPTESLLRANHLRPRRQPRWDDHKYSRGHALIVGGAMTGAARLAAGAAQRAGAGYVTLACAQENLVHYAGISPSLVLRAYQHIAELAAWARADKVDALALGCGLGTDDQAFALAQTLLGIDKPKVLDADIFTLFAQDRHALFAHLSPHCILTPHSGEFARLFDVQADDPVATVRAAAKTSGAIILWKGSCTLIAHPDGRVVLNPPAPPTLATAGTGDILTGIIAALLAQGLDGFEAAAQAVALHSAAARKVGPGLIAEDMWMALADV